MQLEDRNLQPSMAEIKDFTEEEIEGIEDINVNITIDSLKEAGTQTSEKYLGLEDSAGEGGGGGKKKNTGTQTDQKKCPIIEIIDYAHKLYTYTGLHSFETLDAITTCVSDLECGPVTKSKVLSLKERIVLTLCKLKWNLSFSAMQPVFGVSRFTCGRYFRDMIPKLAAVLEVVIPWPTQKDIKLNLPVAFKKFRYTRVVIDCAETPIERSKCLKCRILTYSHYKGTHTVKFKIGVTPSGLISTVSKCYGGRASDKLITLQSHILDKLDVRDGIMADKGFFIEQECLERFIVLHQPAFLSKRKQLSREQALKNAEIARARVHIERVIKRISVCDFVGTKVEWSLLQYFEQSLIIVCGLTNLSSPVLAIDKFL